MNNSYTNNCRLNTSQFLKIQFTYFKTFALIIIKTLNINITNDVLLHSIHLQTL